MIPKLSRPMPKHPHTGTTAESVRMIKRLVLVLTPNFWEITKNTRQPIMEHTAEIRLSSVTCWAEKLVISPCTIEIMELIVFTASENIK